MKSNRISLAVLGFLSLLCSGCMHNHLRFNAVHQGNSLNEIFERQVLNNLAVFTVKPASLPSFAIPDSGSTNVQDKGTLTGSHLDVHTFIAEYFAPAIERQSYGQWNLTPIYDSRRLVLMQCAYQQAVGYAGENCRNCCELDRQFRGGDANNYKCDAYCPIQSDWLGTSCSWWDVPRCECSMYGYYCGTYVWVQPGCEHHFSNLVLRILEYAVADFHVEDQPTKLVRYFIDKNGNATSQWTAFGEVAAEIDINDPTTSILRPAKPDAAQAAFLKELRNRNVAESSAEMEEFPQPKPLVRRAPTQEPGINFQQLQQRLRGVTPPGQNR